MFVHPAQSKMTLGGHDPFECITSRLRLIVHNLQPWVTDIPLTSLDLRISAQMLLHLSLDIITAHRLSGGHGRDERQEKCNVEEGSRNETANNTPLFKPKVMIWPYAFPHNCKPHLFTVYNWY